LARTFPERTLENELQNLKRQIRENEHIWNGFRRVELQMIGAHSLREVITNLVQGLPQLFPRVERVTLACLDPDAELTRLMGAEAPGTEPPFFVALSPEMLASLFPRPWRPRLGPMDDAIRHLLFPGHPAPLASMALTPLVLRAELIGCLNQASREAAHFQPDTGTDLLEHMAAVTAMCLDNAVSHERLKIDGLTDPLTGLYNRRFFERRLREELDRWARRRDSALACMLVDVDHFKCVNDRYGHPVGDRTLQGVARLLGIELRGSDVLARYGGEEFMLLLPDTTLDQGQAIAERLRMRVEHMTPTGPSSPDPRVTVSVGLACLAPGTTRAVADPGAWLLQQADVALYRAKQDGRNRVVCAVGK
jgi:diguanylate cyclase (GGDEF)-like protein